LNDHPSFERTGKRKITSREIFMLTALSVADFLNETASNSPAPGGGSVSALAASLGAALTSMVCRLTLGKKKYAGVQGEMESGLQKSEELRAQCTALIDEDTAAFNALMAAFGLPKEIEEQKARRFEAIQTAAKSATLVPIKLMELCAEALELLKIAAIKGNRNCIPDAGVAALMLRAACEGAALNVTANLSGLQDSAFAEQARAKVRLILENTAISSRWVLDKIREKS
jgi:formiminotetrahydrofolate cyclodeaminase